MFAQTPPRYRRSVVNSTCEHPVVADYDNGGFGISDVRPINPDPTRGMNRGRRATVDWPAAESFAQRRRPAGNQMVAYVLPIPCLKSKLNQTVMSEFRCFTYNLGGILANPVTTMCSLRYSSLHSKPFARESQAFVAGMHQALRGRARLLSR